MLKILNKPVRFKDLLVELILVIIKLRKYSRYLTIAGIIHLVPYSPLSASSGSIPTPDFLGQLQSQQISEKSNSQLAQNCKDSKSHFIWGESTESLGKFTFNDFRVCIDGIPYSVLGAISTSAQNNTYSKGLCKAMGFTFFVGSRNTPLTSTKELATFSDDGSFLSISNFQPTNSSPEIVVESISALICKGL